MNSLLVVAKTFELVINAFVTHCFRSLHFQLEDEISIIETNNTFKDIVVV